MKTKYAAFALCLAPVASAIGSPVTLVENGEARAVIVAPSGRPTLAAEELQRYVEKATGAGLRIVVEDAPRRMCVSVGAPLRNSGKFTTRRWNTIKAWPSAGRFPSTMITVISGGGWA